MDTTSETAEMVPGAWPVAPDPLADPFHSPLSAEVLSAEVLFAEARRRARRRRIITATVTLSAVAAVAVAVVLTTGGQGSRVATGESEAAAIPDTSSCLSFIPSPEPSPSLIAALADDPKLLDSIDGSVMSGCEAITSAERTIIMGEKVGDRTSPSLSRLMSLGDADQLIPTGVMDVLSPDRPVWVVTVHQPTARWTAPGMQTAVYPTYSVVYDERSAELIVATNGSDALG